VMIHRHHLIDRLRGLGVLFGKLLRLGDQFGVKCFATS
jgi:hypothetical protein